MKILPNTNYNIVSRMSSAWSSGLSTYQAIIQIDRENMRNPKPEGNRQFGTVLNGMAIDIQNYSATHKEETSEEHLIATKPSDSVVFKLDGSHGINYIEMLESLFPNTKRDEPILDFNQYGMAIDIPKSSASHKEETSEEHLISKGTAKPSESVIFKVDGSHEINYIEMLESLFPNTKRDEPILDFNQYLQYEQYDDHTYTNEYECRYEYNMAQHPEEKGENADNQNDQYYEKYCERED